ncbi:hypothetical protein [Pseudomonas viridiflava]|uniref:hypothetical protein n=1 Tax=Pseudomonas viridiflava TaxID=33069 RepID=UPI0013CF2988|nr:hypothetical protein [Pseudomonas viridiflava]
MDGKDWEKCLTDHYLRSDGPYGGSPITFLDATPVELAAASDRGWGPEEATRAFLAHFNIATVQGWLGGRYSTVSVEGTVPGYFRFLVLTCLVTATNEGVGNTHNFRVRLGEALGTGATFSAVEGVNDLWLQLTKWCDKRREQGAPIRRLILPDPGRMKLIGHAIRIAFPAWRDQTSFKRLLSDIPIQVRNHPQRLVAELKRPHRWCMVPEAIKTACDDFQSLFSMGQRLLSSHRFWTLVQRIEELLSAGTPSAQLSGWRLEVTFSGYDEDIIDFRLFLADRRRLNHSIENESIFNGSLTKLMSLPKEKTPRPLANALKDGALLFWQNSDARWVFHDQGAPSNALMIVMARSGSAAMNPTISASWTPIDTDWYVSTPLNSKAINALKENIGFFPAPTENLLSIKILGGIKTARHIFLGRTPFLPSVLASKTSQANILSADAHLQKISLSGTPPTWRLESETHLHGTWRLTINEGQLDFDTNISFETDAPEKSDTYLNTTKGFVIEEELSLYDSDLNIAISSPVSTNAWSENSIIADIMEAVYAGAGSGWAECDLVPLIQLALPHKSMVWDVIQSLAEAGWIEPHISEAWRARKWMLCAPKVIDVGSGNNIIEGAVGAAARKRLSRLVEEVGGRLILRGSTSDLIPPMIVVQGVDVGTLSRLSGWPEQENLWPVIPPAPDCWTLEKRTCDGRRRVGAWSFNKGLFLPTEKMANQETLPSIERWIRDRQDDRDVYRIKYPHWDFITTSRTTAILEGYRTTRTALFIWADNQLTRTARSGYLPLPVARAIRLSSLACSGVHQASSGQWTYAYPAAQAIGKWVAGIFGPAIGGFSSTKHEGWVNETIQSRRSGNRSIWTNRSSGYSSPSN